MEFNINDRVRVRDYENLAPINKNKGFARLCGKVGTVTDKLYSEAHDCCLYRVHLDEYEAHSVAQFAGGSLEAYIEPVPSTIPPFSIEIAEDVVIVTMILSDNSVIKGHGHILHDGDLGIAQATSYALKKISEKLGMFTVNGGSKNGYTRI